MSKETFGGRPGNAKTGDSPYQRRKRLMEEQRQRQEEEVRQIDPNQLALLIIDNIDEQVITKCLNTKSYEPIYKMLATENKQSEGKTERLYSSAVTEAMEILRNTFFGGAAVDAAGVEGAADLVPKENPDGEKESGQLPDNSAEINPDGAGATPEQLEEAKRLNSRANLLFGTEEGKKYLDDNNIDFDEFKNNSELLDETYKNFLFDGTERGKKYLADRGLTFEDLQQHEELRNETYEKFEVFLGKMRDNIINELLSDPEWQAFLDGKEGFRFEDLEDMHGIQLEELVLEWAGERGLRGSTKGKEKTDDGKPLRLVSIDNSREELVKAGDAAERRLRGELGQEERFWKKLVNEIWKGGIVRGYYLRKYEEEARKEKDWGLNAEEAAAEEKAMVDRWIFEYDNEKYVNNKREAVDEVATKAVRDIIDEYLEDKMGMGDDAARNLDNAIRRIEESLKDELRESRVANYEQVLSTAKERYEAYKKIAEAGKGGFVHAEAVDTVLEGFAILMGEERAQLGMEVQRSAIDKWADKYRDTKWGNTALVPAAVLTGAALGAFWLGTTGASVALKTVTLGAGGAVVGAVTAAKELNKVERDRGMMARELAVGGEVGDSAYDRDLRDTLYDPESIEKLTGEIRDAMNSGSEEAISLAAMTADARLSLSESLDGGSGAVLLEYSSDKRIWQQKGELVVAIAEAKRWLDEKGSGESYEKYNERKVALEEGLIKEDIKPKDEAFIKLQYKKAAKEGLKNAAFSVVLGEVVSVVGGAVAEGPAGEMFRKAVEALQSGGGAAGIAEWADLSGLGLTGEQVGAGVALTVEQLQGLPVSEINITELSTEQIKSLTSEQIGGMTPAQMDQLTERGFMVSNLSYPLEGSGTVETQVSAREFVENHKTDVTRDGWAQGTGGLNTSYAGSVEGGYGIATRVVEGGTISVGGEAVNFENLVQNGEVKAYMSLNGDMQGTVVEVAGRVTDNGAIEFIPEPGSAAAEWFDESGQFRGRYFEVAIDRGVDAEGVKHIIPVATVEGAGLSGDVTFTDAVQAPTEEVPYYVLTELGGTEAGSAVAAAGTPPRVMELGGIVIPIASITRLTNGPYSVESSGSPGPTGEGRARSTEERPSNEELAGASAATRGSGGEGEKSTELDMDAAEENVPVLTETERRARVEGLLNLFAANELTQPQFAAEMSKLFGVDVAAKNTRTGFGELGGESAAEKEMIRLTRGLEPSFDGETMIYEKPLDKDTYIRQMREVLAEAGGGATQKVAA